MSDERLTPEREKQLRALAASFNLEADCESNVIEELLNEIAFWRARSSDPVPQGPWQEAYKINGEHPDKSCWVVFRDDGPDANCPALGPLASEAEARAVRDGLNRVAGAPAPPSPLQEAALRAFFKRCWDVARNGNDIDGADVQELGEELGLLVKIRREKPCGEGCHCEEYVGVDFPTDCYVPFDSDEGRAALAGTSPPPESTMRPIHRIQLPAPVEEVEYTDEERSAILVSRALSLRDTVERYAAKLGLVFHEEDAGIMVVALEQFAERTLENARKIADRKAQTP